MCRFVFVGDRYAQTLIIKNLNHVTVSYSVGEILKVWCEIDKVLDILSSRKFWIKHGHLVFLFEFYFGCVFIEASKSIVAQLLICSFAEQIVLGTDSASLVEAEFLKKSTRFKSVVMPSPDLPGIENQRLSLTEARHVTVQCIHSCLCIKEKIDTHSEISYLFRSVTEFLVSKHNFFCCN